MARPNTRSQNSHRLLCGSLGDVLACQHLGDVSTDIFERVGVIENACQIDAHVCWTLTLCQMATQQSQLATVYSSVSSQLAIITMTRNEQAQGTSTVLTRKNKKQNDTHNLVTGSTCSLQCRNTRRRRTKPATNARQSRGIL